MSNLSTTIATGFVNQYTDFNLRVHRLAEDLSEKQFWTKPHSYGNSFGNLVLHIRGSLWSLLAMRSAFSPPHWADDLYRKRAHPSELNPPLVRL